MTGFAFAETQTDGLLLAVELKSYNNRYLDLVLTLPPSLTRWEGVLRDRLALQTLRGRVELNVRLKEKTAASRVRVDIEAAKAWKTALDELRRRLGLAGRVRLEDLADRVGVFLVEDQSSPETVWEGVESLLPGLLADFARTRLDEGRRLETDVRRQLAVVAAGRESILARSGEMEAVFRDNLARKFAELAAEVDENRIAAETAVLLMRSGVNEELVRLGSHLAAFEELLAEPGPVGKKLDFLCQEIGREINTIGSKTTFSDVQQRVVTMKDSLENIREQLRNVE